MKILLFLIGLTITCTECKNYSTHHIEETPGTVEVVNFDRDGNIYVATLTITHGTQNSRSNSHSAREDIWTHQLFKLSPSRELIWAIDLQPPIELVSDMQVTSYGDVYLVFYNYDVHETEELTFAVLKSGSKTVEIIENIAAYTDAFFFLDSNDNLFYTREDRSLNVLKPNSTVPVPIKNLEGYIRALYPEYGVEDSKGNIYIGVFSLTTYKTSVALITAESLQGEIPEAQLITDDLVPGQRLFDLVIDKNDDLWIISQIEDEAGYIKKLVNGTVQMIKEDPGHPDLWVTPANDRLYVVGGDILHTVSPTVYYITLDNEVVEIPELTHVPSAKYFISTTVADKDGNAYFKSWNKFSSDLGYSFVMKADQDKPVAVDFSPSLEPKEYLDRLYMDDFGGVWFATSQYNLFYVNKADYIATPVSNFYGDMCDQYPVVTNPVTGEVFLSCFGGLYVALEDNK